ncbi:MAG: RecQ family ATP-dependent DNA helicase, partial [Nanoarchaeota archaeon]|nr:RecQ family ATP-dependent DNA helicase [Nanoarchaeota archaeon]
EGGCFVIIRSNYHRSSKSTISKDEPIKYKIGPENLSSLRFFLRNLFRKEEFMDGQKEILKRTLNRQDTIALLPTGGGKSLCYQLSALLQPGITIIIDPLRSLMIDQTENLKDFGIDVLGFISSDLNAEERKEVSDDLVKGRYQFIFISPERLQIKEFRDKLNELRGNYLISYVVIDEAHCVSEWGHDFRTSYLNIGRISKQYCKYKGTSPPTIALTGTASYAVLSDIRREIGIKGDEAIISPKSYDRKELKFSVLKVPSAEKENQLNACIENLTSFFDVTKEHILGQAGDASFSGIVFCPHVGGDYGVVKVAHTLQNRFDTAVEYYSGKSPRDFTEQEWTIEKRKIQKEFKKNKFPMLVATKAFGMGIDKPNIRYTIHYNLPQSLESFYQEAGRAGRDRGEAQCTIIFSDDNYDDARERLNIESIGELPPGPPRHLQGDIHRLFFFHSQSFKGTEPETEKTFKLLDNYIFPKLNDLSENEETEVLIPFNACDFKNDTEKAIYRLTSIGVVKDYTVDYNANNYKVTIIKKKDEEYLKHLIDYVLRYRNPEYKNKVKDGVDSLPGTTIQKCIKFLIHFVYDEIEKKRRRAIQEMADAARNFSDDKQFRGRVVNYFDSKYAEKLEHIARTINSEDWWTLLKEVTDYDDIQHLVGGCSRTLESYPDHPGLLLLSCYARLSSTGSGHELALDDFARSVREIQTNIPQPGKQEQILLEYLSIMRHNSELDHVNKLLVILLKQRRYRDIAKFALELPNFENNHLMAKLLFLESINNNLKTINEEILNT